MSAEAFPLIEAKLVPPRLRTGYVPRRTLLRLLDELSESKLTLVAAATGFGKTTTLAAWAHGGTRFAWVSLDGADDDPARFLSYVIAALGRVSPEIGSTSLNALRAGGRDPTRTAVPRLLNELTGLEEPVVLILDDYHRITARDCHDSLELIVERSPSALRVVLSSRSDPPLALGRLRALGELSELRAEELRFTEAEARQLFARCLDLSLDEDSVSLLGQRTEGWPAGLYLAALSLRGREDVPAFVSAFAGSNRHVVDYLGSEVVDAQPAALRVFLLRTSILERLSGPLCDAVLGESGSGARLEELAHSNLFLVPLDDNGDWFRYHRLFAELLQFVLAREDPDLVPVLHRRAATWFDSTGHVEEAFAHALAAGETDLAVELLARRWRPLFQFGHHATLRRLLGQLPASVIDVSAPLGFIAAMLAGGAGAPEDVVESRLGLMEESGWEGAFPDSTPSVEVAIAYVRSAFLYGHVGRSLDAANRLLELAPTDFLIGPTAMLGRARALFLQGHLDAALTSLPQLGRETAASRPIMSVYALALRSLVELDAGNHGRALRLGQEAVAVADELGIGDVPSVGIAYTALGSALAADGNVALAQELLERGLDLVAQPEDALPRAFALLALAPVQAARGDVQGARRLLVDARGIIDGASDAGALRSRLEVLETRVTVRSSSRISSDDPPTDAELRVLRLLAAGLSLRETADRLFLSANTVKTHRRALYRKLGARSRDEAVEKARELGFV